MNSVICPHTVQMYYFLTKIELIHEGLIETNIDLKNHADGQWSCVWRDSSWQCICCLEVDDISLVEKFEKYKLERWYSCNE